MARMASYFSFTPDGKRVLSIAILLFVFCFLGINIYGEIYHTTSLLQIQEGLENKLVMLTNLARAQEQLLGLLFISLIVIITLGAVIAMTAFTKVQDMDALLEKRLTAIEAANDGIGIIDSNGNLTYMNRALIDLHGLNDNEAAGCLGAPWVNLYTEKGRQQIRDEVMPVLQKTGSWRGESPIVRRDGTLAYAEMSLTQMDDGVIIGTARDITSQKKAETEKEELQQQFVQAQKMEVLGRLTGGIAHDFNNMLTIISGNLDIIGDHLPDAPAMKNNVDAARRATDHGAELTRRQLAFSRKQILKPSTVNINDIVQETAKLARRVVYESIEIISELEQSPWPIEIDSAQLENALLNLCINARDAMPEHGANKITFKTENVPLDENHPLRQPYMKPGAYVMVSVADTGHGIPQDVIGRVFEPFFTTKAPSKGTGLGLSMVYGFVKQSNGYITIDSIEGEGTTIALFFPRSAQAA